MRRPIQVQLLFPVLSVVLLAIVLASGTSAYSGRDAGQPAAAGRIARVVATLTDPTFPLHEDVLRTDERTVGGRIRGLGRRRAARRKHPPAQRRGTAAARAPAGRGEPRGQPPLRRGKSGPSPAQPVVRLAARTYLARRMPVTRRGTAAAPDWLVVLYPEDQWWAGPGRPPTRRSSPAPWRRGRGGDYHHAGAALRASDPQLGRQTAAIAQGEFQPWPSRAATTRSATWPSPSTA